MFSCDCCIPYIWWLGLDYQFYMTVWWVLFSGDNRRCSWLLIVISCQLYSFHVWFLTLSLPLGSPFSTDNGLQYHLDFTQKFSNSLWLTHHNGSRLFTSSYNTCDSSSHLISQVVPHIHLELTSHMSALTLAHSPRLVWQLCYSSIIVVSRHQSHHWDNIK